MNDTSIQDEEIVNFPVPKRYLPLVIQTLAKAMEPTAPNTASAAEQKIEPAQAAAPLVEVNGKLYPVMIDWTQVSAMKTLRSGLTVPIALTLLDMVAEATVANPGQKVEVSFEDVYKKAGFPDGQRARSSLGAFTKVIKREFKVPYEGAVWPVKHRFGLSGDANYSMLPEVAQAWIQSAD